MQLNHYNSNFRKNKFPIILVCDQVNNAPNIGSLFRISDALGVEEIIFCGPNIPLGKRMKRTSRSTEKYVKHNVRDHIQEVIEELREKDYQLIALEITKSSTLLQELELKKNKPIALIIGNESFGVSEEILNQVDATVHINMYGENSSMNVVQATSITLYELIRQIG